MGITSFHYLLIQGRTAYRVRRSPVVTRLRKLPYFALHLYIPEGVPQSEMEINFLAKNFLGIKKKCFAYPCKALLCVFFPVHSFRLRNCCTIYLLLTSVLTAHEAAPLPCSSVQLLFLILAVCQKVIPADAKGQTVHFLR